jgi:hypothetical protein
VKQKSLSILERPARIFKLRYGNLSCNQNIHIQHFMPLLLFVVWKLLFIWMANIRRKMIQKQISRSLVASEFESWKVEKLECWKVARLKSWKV